MDNAYKGAMDFRFLSDHNGNITQDELSDATEEWQQYVLRAKPLTQSIYHDMPRQDRYQYHRGPTVFVPLGGLMVPQSGAVYKAFHGIVGKLKTLALKRALESRIAFGWTGTNHLVDPLGHTAPYHSNGQHYGPYTRGDDYIIETEEERALTYTY